jgi:hypothetical protein
VATEIVITVAIEIIAPTEVLEGDITVGETAIGPTVHVVVDGGEDIKIKSEGEVTNGEDWKISRYEGLQLPYENVVVYVRWNWGYCA